VRGATEEGEQMRLTVLAAAFVLTLLQTTGSGVAGSMLQTMSTVTVSIPNGFLTGRDFLDLSEQEKNGYVMGFVNGLTVAPLLGADPARFHLVEELMLNKEVTNLDYIAILNEYIANRPGNLDRGLNILSYEAFRLTFVPNL
jgi:hypothetical protein